MLKGLLASAVMPRIIDAVIDSAKRGDPPAKMREVALSTAETTIDNNERVKNALNQEPLWQSGVVNYTVAGFIMSVGTVYLAYKNKQYDERFFLELGTVVATAMAFAKRAFLKSKPMWSRVRAWFS